MLDWTTCGVVERHPGRVSGAWVFRGTRVPVSALFANLEGGATVEEFLEWFPGVSREQVNGVLEHAALSLSALFPRVKLVRHLRDYRLELTFTDGTTRELDSRLRIVGRGGVFRELEDVEFFKRVQVDPEAGTIVWPNGVDFCPDVLYSLATGKPIRVLEPA